MGKALSQVVEPSHTVAARRAEVETMIEKLLSPTNPGRPWCLTYAEKHYCFPTEERARTALALHLHADQVVTFRDGTSPAAASVASLERDICRDKKSA